MMGNTASIATAADRALLIAVQQLCEEAGRAILAVYHSASDAKVSYKHDASPVTEADLAAHRVLHAGLQKLQPSVPVLSEEASIAPFESRRSWPRYWLVDPLDGTREFLARTGEFTVNVALVEAGVPVLGVVHAPLQQLTYLGLNTSQKTAIKVSAQGQSPIACRRLADLPQAPYQSSEHKKPQKPFRNSTPLTVVASRRHGTEIVNELVAQLGAYFPLIELKNSGSSLKMCLIAEGTADFYPRLAPTCEWDTAAAQAIVEAAGGCLVDTDFCRLRYNQKESVLNPDFYVFGDCRFDWQTVLSPR